MNYIKLRRAVLIAPLIAPVVYFFGSLFFLDSYYDYGIIIAVLLSLLTVVIVILPIAYVSTVIIALPIFIALKKLNTLSLINFVFLCSLSVILEFIGVVYYLTSYAEETFESPQIIYFILFGIFLGGSVSYIFGRIAGLKI